MVDPSLETARASITSLGYNHAYVEGLRYFRERVDIFTPPPWSLMNIFWLFLCLGGANIKSKLKS